MGPVAKQLFDFPDVSIGQPPVVRIENAKIEHTIPLDATRVIHVTLSVAQREGAWRTEERLSAMQPRIARACHRSPPCLRAIHENHVIEEIDRLESKNEWRVTMLLENSRGEHGGFEAMSSSCSNDSAKSAHRVAGGFSIVRQLVQPSLNRSRGFQLVDKPPLNCRKR